MALSPSTASLRGVLERIIFLNEENAYTIAELRPDSVTPTKSAPAAKTAPTRPLVTITGALPGVQCGETLALEGEWIQHPQHGAQFKIAAFKSELPSGVYGIRKYLGSGLVPGIGKVYANKIVDHFGAETLRVISEESARLREVEGIGRVRAQLIKRAWDEQRALREVMIFLQTYGVTASQCLRLVKRYGNAASEILKNQPYKAAREIDGIGFKTADKIAINLGFANDAPPRLEAGLLYAMDTLAEEGHTAVPVALLREHTAALLETDPRLLQQRIESLVASHELIAHGPLSGAETLLQLASYNRAEQRIADAVRRIAKSRSVLPPIKVEAAITWAQERAGFTFGKQQEQALRESLSGKITVLTGGPGTGKTTILRALVEILRAKKVRVALAAPTGRAAQRLAETTSGFAQTIHRMLKHDPEKGGFVHNSDKPLSVDYLIIDEASMLDTHLAAALFSAVPTLAHILLVGDTEQLPSVGAGNVLKDVIGSQLAPVTRLEVIYRQKDQSQIVVTAHAINQGDPSLPPVCNDLEKLPHWHDLIFVPANSAEECRDLILRICSETIPRFLRHFHPINDVQVLAPMHKGTAGVAALNQALQNTLNKNPRSLRTLAGELRPGDKLIQLRNNYDKGLFNGDIGAVTSIDESSNSIVAVFDGTTQPFERSEFAELSLAYAISIHKSQGSEYPVVIVPLLKAHFMMLQRNLIYTAITRGKKRVFVVGEPAAWAMAVRNAEAKERSTHLKQKLTA